MKLPGKSAHEWMKKTTKTWYYFLIFCYRYLIVKNVREIVEKNFPYHMVISFMRILSWQRLFIYFSWFLFIFFQNKIIKINTLIFFFILSLIDFFISGFQYFSLPFKKKWILCFRIPPVERINAHMVGVTPHEEFPFVLVCITTSTDILPCFLLFQRTSRMITDRELWSLGAPDHRWDSQRRNGIQIMYLYLEESNQKICCSVFYKM